MDSPPLATSSPTGPPQDDAGVLGEPGTSILFGGTDLTDGGRSGGRFTAGYWLGPCDTDAITVTYMGFQDATDSFSASSDESTSINVKPAAFLALARNDWWGYFQLRRAMMHA